MGERKAPRWLGNQFSWLGSERLASLVVWDVALFPQIVLSDHFALEMTKKTSERAGMRASEMSWRRRRGRGRGRVDSSEGLCDCVHVRGRNAAASGGGWEKLGFYKQKKDKNNLNKKALWEKLRI